MKKAVLLFALFCAAVVAAGPATAGIPVKVTVTGWVEWNMVSAPPLGNVATGETATLTFAIDSEDYADNEYYPTRHYTIDPWSYSLTFESADMDLQDPFPADVTPYFVVRNNDPAVDGFFTSTNPNYPYGYGLPLNQVGHFGNFADSFRVTYTGDTLSSLDILDALGTYNYDDLEVYGWTIDDGWYEGVIGIWFTDLTIEIIPMDEDGDGIMDWDDHCPGTVIPEGVPTMHLGTNRWALVDEDGIFDTEAPNGEGPGLMFDVEDTGGCSCEQIIEATGLGNGHTKFGCSNGAMLNWAIYIAGAEYAPVAVESGSSMVFPESQVDSFGSGNVEFGMSPLPGRERLTPQQSTNPTDRFAGQN